MASSGTSDEIEFSFRACRFGTFRAFPIKNDSEKSKDVSSQFEPAMLNSKGIQFPIRLSQNAVDEILIEIPAKSLKYVEVFMQRGCPVIWIKTNAACAKKIRGQCNINDETGPYFNPNSEGPYEQQIALILAQDPLPFTVSHNIKHIFLSIAKQLKKDKTKFFKEISHKINNDKLVQCTLSMDKVENLENGKKQNNAKKPNKATGSTESGLVSAPSEQTKFHFRTCRLGTLRSFPVRIDSSSASQAAQPTKPASLDANGLELDVQLEQDGFADGTSFKILSKHIQSVEVFLQRGCPVIWIKPTVACAKKLCNLFDLTESNGPYIDPNSDAAPETKIGLITVDPLPFAVSHNIKNIFFKIAANRGLQRNKFFKEITHKENNDRLVENTLFMDDLNTAKKPVGKKREATKNKTKSAAKRRKAN
ncbi:uncharacterized protein LOC143469894 [Clavelina lepadiformis]|uniref:uncharacterized protein LOC143469894 n=1 Tax=Clavelina lepadiformis TaxID=159417 RepID=UPI004040FA4B